MKAIRGATTVIEDTPEDIRGAVGQLLNEIVERNNLAHEDIICIMFSSTSDIRSFYPAKAAREAGFVSCALYSSLEPEISGSLKKCIRVMLFVETEAPVKHVYLNGAVALRKDITKKLNIALDGPAGSGKSTVAKIIAKRFDILYLDTGAMYRTCALACKDAGIDCKDSVQVKKVIDKADISVKYEGGAQKTMLYGKDVSDLLRTPEISMSASTVSAYEFVRMKMVALQREIAAGCSCVLDGRDIGTNVLPDAEFKFYLDASPEIRAERRLKENESKGYFQSFDDVLKEIIERDRQDKNRKFAPLVKAHDAIEIDTGTMNADEVAERIIKRIQERI